MHDETAEGVNRIDGSPGRPVWFNDWDTRLTYEKSDLVRPNYFHQNAVKHGLVRRPSEYPWSSASGFEAEASDAQIRTIYALKIDRVNIEDEYQPVM